MEQNSKEKRTYSRRQFLKGVPLGFAGALVVGTVIGKLLPSSSKRAKQVVQFPEDSIFAPAKDRYPQV